MSPSTIRAAVDRAGVQIRRKRRIFDDEGDVGWYILESPHTVTDNFYRFRNAVTDVIGGVDRVDMDGDFVCTYGAPSFFSCGTVTNLHFAPVHESCDDGFFDSGECDNLWVRYEGPNASGCQGDSGGPVFQGRWAYGIYTSFESVGLKIEGLVCFDGYQVFMPIDYVEEFLGVTLRRGADRAVS